MNGRKLRSVRGQMSEGDQESRGKDSRDTLVCQK